MRKMLIPLLVALLHRLDRAMAASFFESLAGCQQLAVLSRFDGAVVGCFRGRLDLLDEILDLLRQDHWGFLGYLAVSLPNP